MGSQIPPRPVPRAIDDADADDSGDDGDEDAHQARETHVKRAACLGLERKAEKALQSEKGTWRECAGQGATYISATVDEQAEASCSEILTLMLSLEG